MPTVTLAQLVGTIRQELQLVTESLATQALRGISSDAPANALVRPDKISLRIPLALSVAKAEAAMQTPNMAALGLEHLDLGVLKHVEATPTTHSAIPPKPEVSASGPLLRYRVNALTFGESQIPRQGQALSQLEIEFVVGTKA